LVRCPNLARWCGEVESVAWAPGGRWLALSVTSFGLPSPGGIHVIDLQLGTDTWIRRDCKPTECDWVDLDWSSDGARLAFVTSAGIHLVDRDGSNDVLL